MPKVHLKDVTIHYLIEGSGPPLVLLHGLGNNSKSWIHQLEGLKKKYTVIAWDAPGYGQSSDPEKELQRFSQFSDYLKGFLDQLNLDKIFLLGHSMGSAVAIDFSIRFPEMIEKLIIAAPTRGSAGLTVEENTKKREARHHLIENTPPEEIARLRTPVLLSSSTDDSVREYAQKVMSEVRLSGYKSVANSLFNLNQMDDYAKISVPTLVICGEEDNATPVSESEIIVRNIKDGCLKVIPETGHLCYQEKPDIFNDYTMNFFERRDE